MPASAEQIPLLGRLNTPAATRTDSHVPGRP